MENKYFIYIIRFRVQILNNICSPCFNFFQIFPNFD